MSRFLKCFLALLCAWGPSAGQRSSERLLIQPGEDLRTRARVALVIGNATYPTSPLVNPKNDARDMRNALAEMGFAVELVEDADYRKLGSAIDRFVSRVRRGDVALFYYAGHGMQIEGENYLIPTDFAAGDEAAAKYAAYPAARLAEGMERSGAKLNIIVLDACRNNPYRRSRSGSGGLAPMDSGTGTFITLATAPGKTAADNPRSSNGLFTLHLLRTIKEPGLTLDEVFNRTRESVFTASSQTQIPWTQSSVIGKFYFRLPTTGPEITAPKPSTRLKVASPPIPSESPSSNQMFEKAVRESRSGRAAEAISAFNLAIQMNPDDMEAYFERGMTYASLDQYQRALDDFDLIVRRKPEHVGAYLGRGVARINLSRYEEAAQDLSLVIRREPDNDAAYFDRALAYAGLMQTQKAIADYTEVIRRRPKWPSTYYNRGIVYSASGDLRRAIADYTEAIRLRPDYASAYANRGVSYAELADLPKALADLTEAIRLKPEDAQLLNNRGMVFSGMGKPDQALSDFNEAIRLNPLLTAAYQNRAETRRAMGDLTGAQADLTRAKQLGLR